MNKVLVLSKSFVYVCASHEAVAKRHLAEASHPMEEVKVKVTFVPDSNAQ